MATTTREQRARSACVVTRGEKTIAREPEAGPGPTTGALSTVLLLLAATLLLGACDVSNPGPVQDEFLNDSESHEGMINGAELQLAGAVRNLAYDGALPAREIFPTGQIGAHGHPVLAQGGHFEDGQFGNRWNFVQRSRYIAEDALFRFIEEGALPSEVHDTSPLVAEAHLWAGYAYRVLGEHYCDVVFDGGPVEDASRAFERAEEAFTDAIRVAGNGGHTEILQAATAGRAQVRVWLQDWTGAVSDAREISDDFSFAVRMDGDPEGSRNRLWFASANLPYRTLTAWNSWHRDYYLDTGDPRVASTEVEGVEFSTGALTEYGQVPFRRQLKYTSGDDDIPLANGREMRLIEAEALLQDGQWEDAMDLVNEVRASIVSDETGDPLEPWDAGSLEEAWSMLKRERFIEFWLEGRRFGDMRRWEDTGTPGAIDWPDFESFSPIFEREPRSRCLTIPDSERQANPNVPTDRLTGMPYYAEPGATPGEG